MNNTERVVEFGTDGVRDLAYEFPLDAPTVTGIGYAAGDEMASVEGTFVVGGDTRESRPALEGWLANGLNRAGVNVVHVGEIATPGLAYLAKELDMDGAGVITASHNPAEYNGIKFFDYEGRKPIAEIQKNIGRRATQHIPEGPLGSSTVDLGLVTRYTDFLKDSAQGADFGGLRIGFDAAHGAASGYGANVLRELGGNVTSIGDTPDGANINKERGATSLKALQQLVVERGLDLGFAVDGDADRLMMVDQFGNVVDGDIIMSILAITGGHRGVVGTIMTNKGTENALRDRNIDLQRSGVGDSKVLRRMEEIGYTLGAEPSGHVIMEDILPTGDGVLAGIQTIRAVQESGLSLAQWRELIPLFPQETVNVHFPDKDLYHGEAFQQFVESKVEGFGDNGRLILRLSGTEPVVRVTVESGNAKADAHAVAAEVENLKQEYAA